MSVLTLYLLTVLIWGSTWFLITFQLGVVDESVSVFYRFALSALILLVWCKLKSKPMRYALSDHVFMAMQGLCLFSVNYVLIYFGTAYITSGLMAVVFSTMIVLNIINSALFLKRPVRPLVLLGALFGLLGITLVFGHEISSARDAGSSAGTWKGLLLGLLATYSASSGNILSARNQNRGIPVLQSNTWGMLYGSVFLFFYALFAGHEFIIDWRAGYILSMLALVVLGSIVAFGAYLTLVGRIGADRAAYATVLFPLVALLISTVFEGYQWTPIAMIGVALVVAGNLIVIGRRVLRDYAQSVFKYK